MVDTAVTPLLSRWLKRGIRPACGVATRAALKELLAIGSLTIKDYQGTRQLSVGKQGDKLSLTDDLAEALGDAQLVIIPLPSTSHEDLARHVAPHLHDGQVVFLPPGTFGSYVFAKAMADAGNQQQGRLR